MYAKIFSQIFDGTLCTRGPWQALVAFQQLLVLADKDGNVDMTAAAISRRTTIPLDVIEIGIKALSEPDPESRTPDEDGRRIIPLSPGRNWGWHIVNYAKYRAMQREEDRREYHKNYWHTRTARAAEPTTGLNTLNNPQGPQPNQPIAYAEAEAEAGSTARKKRAPPAADLAQLLPDVSPDVRRDWAKLRKEKRAPITETAVKRIRIEAETAGVTMEAALVTACAQGWQGVRADWLVRELKKEGGGKIPWWSSDSGILAKGKEVGIEPRPGETMWDFKGRINSKIEA